MKGTRGKIISLFILIILLILNSLPTTVRAQEGNLEIVVDSTSKDVSPGENATFYWTAYNNDTLTRYDLTVTSSPHSEFSESSFELAPGESHTVDQNAFTSINDENNTIYSYSVTWTGVWYRLASSGSIAPIEAQVKVTVKKSDDGQNGVWDNSTDSRSNGGGNNSGEEDGTNQNGDQGNEPIPGFAPIYLIAVISIALIFLKRRAKEEMQENDCKVT